MGKGRGTRRARLASGSGTRRRQRQQQGKTYEIHHNGARPYRVLVDTKKKRVTVFAADTDTTVFESTFQRIFIGDNDLRIRSAEAPKGKYPGNTILLHRSGSTYVWIGREIVQFTTRHGEPIRAYYSPLGGSDVPYPYAVGTDFTYFLLDYVTVPNALLDVTKDAYPQFYGYPLEGQQREDTKKYAADVLRPATKPFRVRRIHRA